MVCFEVQLERGSGSIMGTPFKVLLVRVSDSNFGRFSVYLGLVFVVLR